MSKKKNRPFAASLSMSEAAAVIDITGVIGWDADTMLFNDLVDQAKQAGATALTVRINSVGGYCYDGLSMGDKLLTCGMSTRGEVYGCAMSMASYLLQCCDTRVAHRNATLMFHQPSACICGTVDEMLQEATYLVGMRDRMFEQMGSRCGKSGAELSAEHMTTKYYTAEQALAYGFLDAIEGEESETAPAPQESPEDEFDPATAFRAFAYRKGMLLTARADVPEDDPENAPEESPAPQPDEEKAPQEPVEEPETPVTDNVPTEPDKEQDPPKESQESPAPQPDEEPTPAPTPEKDEDSVTMTRTQLEELVARRAAEKVAAMGVSPGMLAGAPASPQDNGAQYTRAELDAMPAMVRLRLLRENPRLTAYYANH